MTILRWALTALLLAMCAACGGGASRIESASPQAPRVLIFSHTTGFRHDSIPAGIEALKGIAAAEGLEAIASEDPAEFDPERLAAFDAVIFLSSTTDWNDPSSEWLTPPRQEALQALLARGGAIVGVHAASDSHYHWPWYRAMLGGRFESHPPGTPQGTLSVVAPRHPAVAGLPATITRTDEWYVIEDFTSPGLLVTLDPASIGEAGDPRPIAWAHTFGGGRVFYTAMGHTTESFSEDVVRAHLRGGLLWALGR